MPASSWYLLLILFGILLSIWQLGNPTTRLQKLLVGDVSAKQLLNTTTGSSMFYNYSLPADPRPSVHLMHVGKAGGTTLRDYVIKWKNCSWPANIQRCREIFNGVEESAISNYTKGITHYGKTFGKQLSSKDILLFVVRAPIDRFISWWAYTVPIKCVDGGKCSRKDKVLEKFIQTFYLKCFPSLESFTQALNPSHNTAKAQNTSDSLFSNYTAAAAANATTDYSDCNQLLQGAFQTVGKSHYGHLTAGYRYYYQEAGGPSSINNHTIVTIRTEFFWNDVVQFDLALGGHGDFHTVMGKKETHGSEAYWTKHNNSNKVMISSANMPYVCCALWPEMVVYRTLVEQAVNLLPQQRIQTYQKTWNQCHVQSWEALEQMCDGLETSLN
ncbi:unknown protein [Seminavis robusta]|uniref:Uncharacterized protein n=1 Tax=Seminavis robusta TaxID=568900 RepID=A0A9N8EN33_9STRA|nr:unknown protein [Seminavis robusta]|eukprot:Sro1405_g269820.1 n/a (385) ;mRNA; f:15903-17057